MRFREGSMRSFRELSRGSKIHSKHPKKRQYPPRSIPRHCRRTSASELERGSHPLQGERHTSRDSLEAGRDIKAEDTKKAARQAAGGCRKDAEEDE